jgi:hypothetical protein
MPSFDVEMTFDRPFLYGIVDLESTLPLFVGVLENPIEYQAQAFEEIALFSNQPTRSRSDGHQTARPAFSS